MGNIVKDNFSKQSQLYAQFRPAYPQELFDFLLSLVPERKRAWDCGAGNGQVAVELAKRFEKVFATDISENQIRNAVRKENIFYKVERAEQTSFPNSQFDLITVAQAIHWFDFAKFYQEVDRTLKPHGVLAIIGYPLLRVDEETDKVIGHLYENILCSYWDKERKYIDELYQTIPFPYKEIKTSNFKAQYEWDFEQLIGFISTWSAVQHYIARNNQNPIDKVIDDLRNSCGKKLRKTMTFPILLRVGKKKEARKDAFQGVRAAIEETSN